jgi:sugar phosphate isomerase/epimerase
MKLPRNFFRIQHTDPTLLPQKLEEIFELGLGLELRDFMLPDLLDSPRDLEAWITAYREITGGRLSFSVYGPVIDLSLGSVDKKIRQVSIERIIQVIEITEELSAEFLVVHTGYDHRFLNEKNRFESWVKRSLESYAWIFNKANIPEHLRAICIENSPGEPLEAYWIYLRALKKEFAGIPIHACIDYDHLLIRGF